MIRLAATLAVAALLPAAALASGQGVLVVTRWKTMDICAKQAQTAFPDFTPEANAKREAKLKECLQNNNLPPREAFPSGK